MKRLLAKIVLAGLIASSTMPLQAFWGAKTTVVLKAKHGQNSLFNQLAQKMGNGLTYIKNSIYNASTETKLLVGCAALATAGISYLLYRHLNPTDQELIDAAQPYIREAQRYIATMPIVDPLNEDRLNDIGGGLSAQNLALASLAQDMKRSRSALEKQHAILKTRIIRYENAKQYTPIDLVESYDAITPLIKALSDRINIINTHGHYFNLVGLQCAINKRYAEAIKVKNNERKLVAEVRRVEKKAKFQILSFVDNVDSTIISVENELAQGRSLLEMLAAYNKKRGELRMTKDDLATVRATVLGSPEYTNDQARKDTYDAEQRKLALDRQRLAQEQERIRIEAERARIERERLALERENNQRERENHRQQHPNRPQAAQLDCVLQ